MHSKQSWAYWSQSPEDLLRALSSSFRGLTAEEAQERLQRQGPNALRPPRRKSGLSLFLGQFKSPIIMVLLFATAVSAILKDWVDAAIILLIVLGSALLSYSQEHQASPAGQTGGSRKGDGAFRDARGYALRRIKRSVESS